MTINGELAKLGWNITQGHGIHAGIHFRSSNYYSLLLGEQVGISVLQDRAQGYNEPFTIQYREVRRHDRDDLQPMTFCPRGGFSHRPPRFLGPVNGNT